MANKCFYPRQARSWQELAGMFDDFLKSSWSPFVEGGINGDNISIYLFDPGQDIRLIPIPGSEGPKRRVHVPLISRMGAGVIRQKTFKGVGRGVEVVLDPGVGDKGRFCLVHSEDSLERQILSLSIEDSIGANPDGFVSANFGDLRLESAAGQFTFIDGSKVTATPEAAGIPVADGSGKLALGWLPTGSGSGLDADTLDGIDSTAFQLRSEKDAANGYAGLDASARIKAAAFPVLTGDVTTAGGSLTTAIAAGAIVDADINASGITTRSKLPAAVAYEDEANTFTGLQRFEGRTEFQDEDGTPVADRRWVVIDGLFRSHTTANAEGRHVSRSSLEQIKDAEIASDAAIAWSKIDKAGSNLTDIATRDHGSLTGLLDDDHSVYALLAGRAGDQVLAGGTALGGSLSLYNAPAGSVEASVVIYGDGLGEGTVEIGVPELAVLVDGNKARFEKPLELLDADASPVADRRLRVIDGLVRAASTGNVEGRHISRLSLEQITAAEISDNAVSDAKLRDSAALSVIGRASNTSGDPADIAAGTDGHVLRRSGTTLGFGLIVNANVDAAAAIAFSKLASMTDLRLLGRAAGSAGTPHEITMGTNMTMLTDGTLNTSALAHGQVMQRIYAML